MNQSGLERELRRQCQRLALLERTLAERDQTIRSLRTAAEQAGELPGESARGDRLGPLGVLAAGLAHELSQPLTVISTTARACQRLLASGDGTEVRKALRRIADQAERAGRVVRRLRHFARTGEPHRGSADLNDLIRQALALCEPELRTAGVRVRVRLAEGLPTLAVDRVQIEQVLVNLLRNALEAMAETPPGRRELSLTSRGRRGVVEVAVRDSGCGLTSGTAERLFQPGPSAKPQGLGLGLALCRALVQGHGGWMWVKPNPGRGCTFFFALPTDTGEATDHAPRPDRLPRRR